jgi:LacI family transcriptional regulator
MTDIPQIAVFIEDDANYNLSILLGTLDFCRGRQRWDYLSALRREVTLDEMKAGRTIDGIIAQLGFFPEADEIARQLHIPIVDVTRSPVARTCSQVLPDDVAVGRIAAEYFAERGFKRFGFVGFPEVYSRLRQKGFEMVVAKSGGTIASLIQGHGWAETDDQRLAEMRRWLRAIPKPLALMVATDVRARDVLLECRKLGIGVPEEISIISVDDDESICQLATPPLSSIRLDGHRAGYQTAALLDRMMRGEMAPLQSIPIPPLPIRHRRSSDAFAIADEEVSAALRFVWENADRDISVADVAEAVSISRRSLQVRFRSALGRTVQSEIWRSHIDRAKEMLAHSNIPLWQVAERSGFRRSQALSRLFHRETGMTPRAYRQSFHA